MYIISKSFVDMSVARNHSIQGYYTFLRTAILLIIMFGARSASADNFFEFSTPYDPLDEQWEPDGYTYPGYPLDENGEPKVIFTDIVSFFSFDECRLISDLTVSGNYIGDQKLKVSKLVRIYNDDGDMPDTPHLLGNLPSRTAKRSGKIEIGLRPNPFREDGLWDISRIEVEAANVSDIDSPSLIISGKEVLLPSSKGHTWVVREFDEDEGLIDRFSIAVNTGRPIAFRRIRIQLREVTEYPSEWTFTPSVPQNNLGQYEIPAPEIGGIGITENSECLVYNPVDMSQVSVESVPDVALHIFNVSIPGFGKFGVSYNLNEKFYGLPVSYAAPSAERLLPFTINSDFITTYTINDAPFMDGITYVHKQAPLTTGHDWSNAVLGNIPEGVVIYWKVEQDDSFSVDETPAPADRKGIQPLAETDEPEGFTKYDPQTGIDLTKGNRLHLISEMNGNRSNVFSTYYTPYIGPTNVTVLPTDKDGEILRRLAEGDDSGLRIYTPEGIRINYSDALSGSLLIAVTPEGYTLKFRKVVR